jgi:hypothetical protein
MCHCLACKRRSGSAFSIQARWPADRVRIEGDASEFVLVGDEGSAATFRFCPSCGATVYFDDGFGLRRAAASVGCDAGARD